MPLTVVTISKLSLRRHRRSKHKCAPCPRGCGQNLAYMTCWSLTLVSSNRCHAKCFSQGWCTSSTRPTPECSRSMHDLWRCIETSSCPIAHVPKSWIERFSEYWLYSMSLLSFSSNMQIIGFVDFPVPKRLVDTPRRNSVQSHLQVFVEGEGASVMSDESLDFLLKPEMMYTIEVNINLVFKRQMPRRIALCNSTAWKRSLRQYYVNKAQSILLKFK